MAAVWAVVLALGAWTAPGIAASGSEDNEDARDQEATDSVGAALRFLKNGSEEDAERADAALCDGASPQVSSSDLDDLRQSYDEEFGGIERVNLDAGEPVSSVDGIEIAVRVWYVYQSRQESEDFLVTVQEDDGVFCVSETVLQSVEEEPSESGTTGIEEEVDTQAVATDFLRAIVVDREPQTAASFQCQTFTGITPQELNDAITDWAEAGETVIGYLDGFDSVDSDDSSVDAFAADIKLDGDMDIETFSFQLTVQGDCVSSLEGGDDLI
ncbi:hypothetical protein [Glycomyces sambucus]|nr:hypothetical protein [Glycomyces sambucus]